MPVSFEPPQWLTNIVGRPVDMTSVGTAIGGALVRATGGRTHEDQLMDMRRSQIQMQMEAMRARAATETTRNLIQQQTIRLKAESDIEMAQFAAATGGDHRAILDYKYPGSNSLSRREIERAKVAASKDSYIQADEQQQVALNVTLAKLRDPLYGDADSARKAASLGISVRQNKGWTPDLEAQLGEAAGELNARRESRKAEADKADAGDVVGQEVTMPDGSTIMIARNTTGKGYTVIPKKADVDASIASKVASRKISRLESEASAFEKQYVAANAEYVKAMSGKKSEGEEEKALKDKADYFRAQQNKKLQQADKLRAPPAAPNAPAASASSMKRPTKAIAADYVQRLGRDKAIEALKQEGYDTSGYAD